MKSSSSHRLSFSTITLTLAVVLSLSLPWLMSQVGLYRRSSAYLSAGTLHDFFPYIYDQIYKHDEPIDILFLGPSFMWAGIDTPSVQKAMSKRLGREAKVITFGWNWTGEGLKNIFLRDVLAHRKVNLVITSVKEVPKALVELHPLSAFWVQYDDLPWLTGGLSFLHRAQYYALSVIGAPRHLLANLRADKSPDFSRLKRTLGAELARKGFDGANFESFRPTPAEITADEMILSSENRANFLFNQNPLSPNNQFLLNELARMTFEQGTRLAFLRIPTHEERRASLVEDTDNWAEMVGGAPYIGVAPKRLFKDLSEEQIYKLYYNEHFNENGAFYFTKAILPAIEKVFTGSENVAGSFSRHSAF